MIRYFQDVDGKTHKLVTWSFVKKDFETTKNRIELLKDKIKSNKESVRKIMDTSILDKDNCHKIIDLIFDDEFDPLHPLGYIDATRYEDRVMGLYDYEYNTKGLQQILYVLTEYESIRAMINSYNQDIKRYNKHLKYDYSILNMSEDMI